MKPESILQTDLLDILFEHRNKEYGAYHLRKHYDRRLAKALAVTFIVVLLLSVTWYVNANYFKTPISLIAGEKVSDVHLQDLEELKKPKQDPKPKRLDHNLAKAAHTNIAIVPDNQADKAVAKVEELDDKIISTTTEDGIPGSGNEVAPPADEGAGDGAVIEPKKVEQKVPDEPLLVAEVMPEFPGGREAFLRYMLRHLQQPEELAEGEKIVVMVKFVVEADGSIVNVEVVKSGGSFDKDVLNVVRNMPRWKPGMQQGRFVPVYFTLPVTFTGADN